MQTEEQCVIASAQADNLAIPIVVRNEAVDHQIDGGNTRIIAYSSIDVKTIPRLIRGERFALLCMKL